jgi:hypothetical protein
MYESECKADITEERSGESLRKSLSQNSHHLKVGAKHKYFCNIYGSTLT